MSDAPLSGATSTLNGPIAVIQIQSSCLGLPCHMHLAFRPTARISRGTGRGPQYADRKHRTEQNTNSKYKHTVDNQ